MYPPPPGMEKLKSQVNVTILVLADAPPSRNWTKHECYKTKIISREVIKYILQSTPTFQNHYLILYLNRKLVNFNLKWIWIYGLKPHPPPLSSQRYKMLIFGLRSTSDDWSVWWMDLNPICHPSPAKKVKYSSLDYIQLLLIGWAGRWTRTPSATPLQPKK